MQRDMLRIARELVKLGHTVEIFAISWEGDMPEQGIRVHVLPTPGWINYQRYQRFIDAAHAEIAKLKHTGEACDFVVGFNRAQGLDAYFAADPCFIERAHAQRNFLYRLTPRYRWFQQCEQVIFSAGSHCSILLLSNQEKLDFQKWYQTPEQQFHFIPPYLSGERLALQGRSEMRNYLRNAFNFATQDFVFLLVGSGFYMKGLDRAIKALASLPKNVLSNVRLVAVGQDNPRPFNKLADKLGVGKHLHISTGRSDIPQLMQGADVYVHPAYRENTGLVLLEALASGLPVLATATCGYAYHIKEADAGRVADEPFSQDTFNTLFYEMVATQQREVWSQNGIAYAQQLMRANDGSAEANILTALARQKTGRHTQDDQYQHD